MPTRAGPSSAREFGAFGKGKDPFSEAAYLRLNFRPAFKSFAAKGLRSHLFIAVGDDEWKDPEPADYTHMPQATFTRRSRSRGRWTGRRTRVARMSR